MITFRRTTPPSPSLTVSAEPPYTVPILTEDAPGREANLLLGSAWRSSTARLVETGHCFDVVRTPQQVAPPVGRVWSTAFGAHELARHEDKGGHRSSPRRR